MKRFSIKSSVQKRRSEKNTLEKSRLDGYFQWMKTTEGGAPYRELSEKADGLAETEENLKQWLASNPGGDDRRPCAWCLNLARDGMCLYEKRNGYRYRPLDDMPRRCIGYSPGNFDADRRGGVDRWPREVWPELYQTGGRIDTLHR